MSTGGHNPNPGAGDPLDAGIAENIISSAPGIDLPEADFAVPIYQPQAAAPLPASSSSPSRWTCSRSA